MTHNRLPPALEQLSPAAGPSHTLDFVWRQGHDAVAGVSSRFPYGLPSRCKPPGICMDLTGHDHAVRGGRFFRGSIPEPVFTAGSTRSTVAAQMPPRLSCWTPQGMLGQYASGGFRGKIPEAVRAPALGGAGNGALIALRNVVQMRRDRLSNGGGPIVPPVSRHSGIFRACWFGCEAAVQVLGL